MIAGHTGYFIFCSTALHAVHSISLTSIVRNDMGVRTAYKNFNLIPDIHFCSDGSSHTCAVPI